MRIRRCASRLLGSTASAPSLPPPSPPPAHESHAGFAAASGTSSSSLEPCKLSSSPWDLMAQLDLSDPQAERIFFETYLVAVAWRASWLFQLHPSMPATCSIKEEEQHLEDIFQMHGCKKNAARKKKAMMKPNSMNREKIKAEESEDATAPMFTCKKNGGRSSGWFCWRPVSRPNSFCSYHSDQRPKRKTDSAVGEGFYYYAGFDPSRSKRRRVLSGSDGVPETRTPTSGQKEEAPPDAEEDIAFTEPQAQAQADGADHQAAPPMSDDSMAGIAGFDEESSDDDVFKSRETKSKIPLEKRLRKKPVKARSLKSLMYG